MRIRHMRRQPSVVGRLQQRAWTAADGSARSVIEVVAEELGPSLTGAPWVWRLSRVPANSRCRRAIASELAWIKAERSSRGRRSGTP